MHYLTQWTLDPFVIVAAVAIVWQEAGLAHLAHRSRPQRTVERRRRSFFFYGGLAVVVLTVSSPIDHWSYDYFYVHMIEHISLMFFAPVLIVAGAPWLPLAHGVPVRLRRRIGRALLLGPWAGSLRTIGRFLSSGLFAVVAFSAVMVVWHLPAPFDFAQSNRIAHIWLMNASFLVAGVLFWLQIFPSYPLKPKLGVAGKIGALVATNVVMLILAMALSIFSTHSWYSVYDHLHGVTLSPFADQQIGAAILWVCGDFWALPSLIWVVRKALEEEDSPSDLLDRLLVHRATAPSVSELPPE